LQTPFTIQAKALLRKNLQQQRRAVCTNVFIVVTPIFFCILLFVLQKVINNALDKPDNRCGCLCLSCCSTPSNGGPQTCRVPTTEDPCQGWEDCQEYDTNQCGFQYSDADQAGFCAVPSPSIWPALFSIPSPGYLAHPYSPKGAVLVTGQDETLVNSLNLFADPNITAADTTAAANFAALGQETGAVYAGALSLLGIVLGSFKKFSLYNYYIEPAFIPTDSYNGSLSLLVSDATSASTRSANDLVSTTIDSLSNGAVSVSVGPLAMDQVFLPTADDINQQLYCGYADARCNSTSEINGYVGAYDFGNTNPVNGTYSVRMWYNATRRYGDGGQQPTQAVRVHGALNAATDAFLQKAINPSGTAATSTIGGGFARLAGLMEMPKPSTSLTLDIASLVGTLFYCWLLQLLLPVMLSTLVSEKEGRLRTMMKMHGLGDAAYWAIQYLWYFLVNMVYVWILIGVGSAIQLAFFTRTEYSFQFVFFLLWVLCLVAFTFLLATIFRSARTAVVVAFLYVFASGLIGYLLLQSFVAAGHWWAVFFNIVPGFALYRGLFEISQYAFRAAYSETQGMTWAKLGDSGNGLPAVMGFFAAEAVIFLLLAWYLEQVIPGGVGVPRHPLFFLGKKYKSELAGEVNGTGVNGASNGAVEKSAAGATTATETNSNNESVGVAMEPVDVATERQRVADLVAVHRSSIASTSSSLESTAILVQNLQKVFPGKLKKVAVRDLTMAVARGEVFGLLGPNGAGKSTTLNILTGFLQPTSGNALVQGYDIRTEMENIYGIMGVCPQDNLLWPQLTAREHLSFYGRLKGLTSPKLEAAVEAGLRAVNLWNGGVVDKQVKTFSGGMKRRLSVAISLIGDPQVVYLDEPSTGLDPSSRQNLWSVVKSAKAGRGIILTTHSMEEAAALCDRLGIFVDGQLVCIGAPKELTARYGGYLVFTATTAPGGEAAIEAFVHRLSPSAKLTYAVGETFKYELSTSEVSLSTVFGEMESAVKSGQVQILDWGVANATLEEVFIKFAKSIGAEGGN
jgi:ABC-type multidrug transport system ATPase subunit